MYDRRLDTNVANHPNLISTFSEYSNINELHAVESTSINLYSINLISIDKIQIHLDTRL